MTKLKKIAITNSALLQKLCEQAEAQTGYFCYSADNIIRLCNNEEDTALFLEFTVSQADHKKLCDALGSRCYCRFGAGQLECGRDDLPEPLWCVNWLENRTQAYNALCMLRNMGITIHEADLVKGLDCIPMYSFK